ncbi:polysaccharide biosynthesis protein GumN [Vibrio galatheae]|uniref:Polysaccharide biosynthesis protein GumN n=1 Tax=Vibrio galatheae TaxID=579748 RepID=A0A0F4NR43_9VIBR|nr:TraB/GumN family protein [Vibrio galatheae]KJY85354.1 polysaccharide biosynthesis protein GumN [Vibrio galatheae]
MFRLWLLFFTLAFSASSSSEPLYWHAQKGQLNYLILGSVHVGDESMYPLPQTITNSLKQSDGLIIETDIRKNDGVTYPPVSLLTNDVLDDNQKAELKGIANLLNLDFHLLMQLPPWTTALTITNKQIEYLGYQSALGVDIHLMYKATTQNIPVISLETLQFQIDMLTKQPNSGKELLVSAIEEFDHSEQTADCLIESWKVGDQDKMLEFGKLTEISPELEHIFVTLRNVNWAKQLATPSWSPEKKGSYVMVVGALHLLGEQSVLKLLEADGFKVTQLSKSQVSRCEYKH